MKSKKAKTTISIVIVAILCLLLSTLFYSVYANRKMFENLKVQIDTRTVIITLKDNLSILLNAETGERGYVITGNANYLQPYTGARQQLNENMKMLDSMLHRDTNLLAELDSLEYYVNRKMSYIETVINLKKINDEKTIKALLNTGEGKELMDKARAHNLTLQAAEQVLFKERKNVADNSIRRTQIFFLSDGVFSLLIVLFLASVIINELNRRTRHEKKLKDYTVELQRKNEEIGQFAYIASHDLQQPLRSISNFTGLLEEKIGDAADDDTKQYMNFIRGGATRMSSLITDLLEYSRVGKELKKERIDCNIVVKEIISELDAIISETGAKITVGKLPVLTGYIYLKSVFRNLLVNAVKFTQQGVMPVINISARDTGEEYLFTVQDNGIGIEQAYMDKIFIIFQRLHSRQDYPGTGIGLSICKKIVELHGGKIWVESEPGKGSSFHFTVSKQIA